MLSCADACTCFEYLMTFRLIIGTAGSTVQPTGPSTTEVISATTGFPGATSEQTVSTSTMTQPTGSAGTPSLPTGSPQTQTTSFPGTVSEVTYGFTTVTPPPSGTAGTVSVSIGTVSSFPTSVITGTKFTSR